MKIDNQHLWCLQSFYTQEKTTEAFGYAAMSRIHKYTCMHACMHLLIHMFSMARMTMSPFHSPVPEPPRNVTATAIIGSTSASLIVTWKVSLACTQCMYMN